MSHETATPQPTGPASHIILAELEVYRPLVQPEGDPTHDLQAALVKFIGDVTSHVTTATEQPKAPIIHPSDYARLQKIPPQPITIPEEGLQAFTEHQLPHELHESARSNVRTAWNGIVYARQGGIALGIRGLDGVSLYEDRLLYQQAVARLAPSDSLRAGRAFQNKYRSRYGLELVSFDQPLPEPHRTNIKYHVRNFLGQLLSRNYAFTLGPVEYDATTQETDWFPKV